MNRWAMLVLLLAPPIIARAEDPRLAEIRSALQHIREEGPRHQESRGASPELTTVKHELRDWVESHLVQLGSDPNDTNTGEESFLAGQLNAELRTAHLLCPAEDQCVNNTNTWLGYLGPIRLQFRQRESYLIVVTSFGVGCGFDESAYLYVRDHDHWNRIWESEQNIYTKKGYTPQNIHAVLVSPSAKEGTPLVMTLGTQPWCSSSWRDNYVRVWKVSSESKLLLDQTRWAWAYGLHDIPMEGSIGPEDALIELTVGSFDPGIHHYEEIWHYRIQGDKLERIDPVALNPRDFTEEWLAQPWTQSALWSQPSSRTSLQGVHDDDNGGEFAPTLHCRQRPDLWQVGIDRSSQKKGSVYFLVRWRPPYHFTMVRALNGPAADCTEKDPGADDPATLFPIQDWRD